MFDFFKRNKDKATEQETAPTSPETTPETTPAAPDEIPEQDKGFFDFLKWNKDKKSEDTPALPEESPETPIPPPSDEALPEEDIAIDPGLIEQVFVLEDIPPQSEAAAQAEKFGEAPEKRGFFSRLREGLNRTRDNLVNGIDRLTFGKKQIDDELLEDLEAVLLSADLGIEASTEIIDKVTERVRRKDLTDPIALTQAIRQALLDILKPRAQPWHPTAGQGTKVLLMVGINGAGKTTTIGKLAARWKGQGLNVLLAAGDTFRAAAVEQLQQWGERVQVPVVAQHTGADSASVVYDGFAAAQSRKADLLIADTAGRLHTQSNLMEELKKVKRVLGKLDPQAPQEIWLVLDAGTGQNALNQARQFHEAVGLTGICITKLDGTAKGGVIAAIAKALPVPIRYIGVGEKAEDLRPFDAEAFVDALFTKSANETQP